MSVFKRLDHVDEGELDMIKAGVIQHFKFCYEVVLEVYKALVKD
jgi:hypothetical protein